MARKLPEPKARKLKVFRTAIGFHDAYVAAPSRKAALAAWGTSVDLFARGAAEEVGDPALAAAPLAAPGEVVRRPRGTADEFLAALPPTPRRSPRARSEKPEAAVKPHSPPSRAALDAAEAALAAAEQRFRAEATALRDRERALADDRRALDQRREREMAALEQTRAAARAAYEQALTDRTG